MRLSKLFPGFGIATLSVASSFILLRSAYAASMGQEAGQQSQQQAPLPARETPPNATAPSATTAPAHQRKVWTNEDLIALRTPADIYLLEKEAREAAEAAAAAAKELADLEAAQRPPTAIKLPETQDETEKALKDTQSNVEEVSAEVEKMQKELENTPEEQRAEKQKDLDRLTADLAKLKQDAKALEDHLKALTEKSTENPPATPLPPPSVER